MSDSKQTWRQQFVEIPANSVKDVFFLDSKPNAFFIANNNETEIYIGITATPTTERYDKMLNRYDSDTFGRPTPTNRIYILNPSNTSIHVNVYSAENMFDMALLKNFKVEIQASALNQIKYDGIIRGVKSGFKLPVEGSFTAQFPETLTVNFPTNASVDLQGTALSNLNTIVQVLAELMYSDTVSGKVNLKTLVDKLSSVGQSQKTDMKAGAVTASENITFSFTEIDTIVNDSTDALVVEIFDKNGTSKGTFTLKQDESLNDIDFEGSKINFSSTGTVNARYLLLG